MSIEKAKIKNLLERLYKYGEEGLTIDANIAREIEEMIDSLAELELPKQEVNDIAICCPACKYIWLEPLVNQQAKRIKELEERDLAMWKDFAEMIKDYRKKVSKKLQMMYLEYDEKTEQIRNIPLIPQLVKKINIWQEITNDQAELLLKAVNTLDWMIKDMDYRNRQNNQVEDSPELIKAKELLKELRKL